MNFRGAPFIKEFKIQLDLVYTTLMAFSTFWP
ncbi:hypothetical protein GLYMA_01G033400v4 [Glycine max]|uniref:Uncharacterized protein n=1 Tax=Glycine max TaxID=3847 RepID=A0A0R0L5X1_SOYBN|nr:hypothetical protein GYH30_000343 [Glycine max]KRH74637.1 hypothetical protein GLYMA_01G033400v4 [Glycine max]